MTAVVVNEPVDRSDPLRAPRGALRSRVAARDPLRGHARGGMGDRARAGDGVVGAAGRVNGRPVFAYAQDTSFAGGSLGEAHADTIVRVLRARRPGAARPSSASSPVAGARMQEGVAALAGYGRIFAEHVRLSGPRPADLRHRRDERRRRLLLAGADRLRGDDPGARDVPHRPRRRARGDGRGRRRRRRSAGPRVHERNGVCHLVVEDDRGRAAHVRATCCATARSTRRGPAAAARAGRARLDPGDVVPPTRARSTTSATCSPASSTAASCSRSSRAGRATSSRGFAPPRGPRRRRDRQPAALDRRRARRRLRAEGRALRAHVQHVQPAAAGVRRHARVPAGHRARSGPASSATAPTLLHAFAEGEVPEADGRPAQGVRRRIHHHELAGARRAPGFAWPGAELGVMGARQAVGHHPPPPSPRTTHDAPRRGLRGGSTCGARVAAARRPRRRDHRARGHPRAAGLGPARRSAGLPHGAMRRPLLALRGPSRHASRPRPHGHEADVVAFAGLTGDFHPQHIDAEWAAQSPVRRAHRPRAARARPRRRAGRRSTRSA